MEIKTVEVKNISHYARGSEETPCYSHFMEFIDKSYDFDIHSVHDCLASHKMCCEENDNPIEED
jgi:hypothetical protein